MKILVSLLLSAVCVCNMSAQTLDDLKNLLKGSGNKTEQTSDSSSSLGGTLGSILGNVLGNDKITPADLVGSWKYSAPAVTFKSDNMLKKAGGAAASATIENKLKPYYQRAGVDRIVLTVNNDSTFVMKLAKGSLSGTLAQGEPGFMQFKFKAMKKINLGTLNGAVSKVGNQISVTFDISKLMTLVNRIASISGNSTLKGVNSMLQSYDGMQAGFRMTKTAAENK